MIVTMPDGTDVDFPDDMPKEQIRDLISSKYSKKILANQLKSYATPGTQIAGRLGRMAVGGAASVADLPLLAGKTAALGLSALTGNETLNQIGQTPSMRDTAVNLYDQMTRNRFQPKGAEGIIDFMGEMAVPVGIAGKVTQMASKAPSAINTASQAVADLPNFLTSMMSRGAATKAGVPENIASQMAMKSQPILPRPTSENIKQRSGDLFKEAEKIGGTLSPNFINSFLDDIQKQLPQTKVGQVVSGKNEATVVMERLNSLRDTPLDFASAKELDEALGEIAESYVENGRYTAVGKKVKDFQNAFRDKIDDAAASDIGDKNAFSVWKQAKDLWKRQIKAREIENVISRAELTDNPSTAIKTGFRNLSENANKSRMYTKAEREAIRKVAESNLPLDAARAFGSRLMTIGGTLIGGPGAAAAAYAAPTISREAADAMSFARANKALDMVMRYQKPTPPISQNVKTPLNVILNTLASERLSQ